MSRECANLSRSVPKAAASRGPIALPAPGSDDVLVRALYSGISRGTETLVFGGGVPPNQYGVLRAEDVIAFEGPNGHKPWGPSDHFDVVIAARAPDGLAYLRSVEGIRWDREPEWAVFIARSWLVIVAIRRGDHVARGPADDPASVNGYLTDLHLDACALGILAAKRIPVIDHSKFSQRALHELVPLTAFDTVIVDSQTPRELIENLSSSGVNV
jgi:hypothetical protein